MAKDRIQLGTLPHFPAWRRLAQKAARGNAAPLIEALRGHRGPRWDDRAFLLELVAEDAPLDLLDVCCGHDPTSPETWLLRGTRRLFWAWEARGSGHAETVGEEAARQFFRRLYWAEADLLWSAELLPEDPIPYAELMTAAKGLQHGVDEILHLLEQAVERDPLCRTAYSRAVDGVSAKWGGSHEQMFALARRAAALAGPANDLAIVLVKAHVERWLYFSSFDDDPDGAASYLRTTEVQQEVASLFDRTMRAPHYLRQMDAPWSLNTPAFWFYLTGDRQRLAYCLEKISGRYTESPWAYLGPSAEVIERALGKART